MNVGVYGLTSQTARDTHAMLGRRTAVPSIDQHYHAEATDWWGRVLANGGTVSHSTLLAVSRFCTFVEQNGIREFFHRLNLFCGDNLSAALVPLYRGPRLTLVLGNAIDTNFNFVSADYTETGGLDPGATNSTKYLRTGLTPNDLGRRSGHLSAYMTLANSTASAAHAIGALTGASRYRMFGGGTTNPGENLDWGLNSTTGMTAKAYTGGHIMVSADTDANAHQWVVNGSPQPVIGASTRSPLANSFDFWVFTLNNNASPFQYLNQVMRSYSIGISMTRTQSLLYYQAMQRFQSDLGRQV